MNMVALKTKYVQFLAIGISMFAMQAFAEVPGAKLNSLIGKLTDYINLKDLFAEVLLVLFGILVSILAGIPGRLLRFVNKIRVRFHAKKNFRKRQVYDDSILIPFLENPVIHKKNIIFEKKKLFYNLPQTGDPLNPQALVNVAHPIHVQRKEYTKILDILKNQEIRKPHVIEITGASRSGKTIALWDVTSRYMKGEYGESAIIRSDMKKFIKVLSEQKKDFFGGARKILIGYDASELREEELMDQLMAFYRFWGQSDLLFNCTQCNLIYTSSAQLNDPPTHYNFYQSTLKLEPSEKKLMINKLEEAPAIIDGSTVEDDTHQIDPSLYKDNLEDFLSLIVLIRANNIILSSIDNLISSLDPSDKEVLGTFALLGLVGIAIDAQQLTLLFSEGVNSANTLIEKGFLVERKDSSGLMKIRSPFYAIRVLYALKTSTTVPLIPKFIKIARVLTQSFSVEKIDFLRHLIYRLAKRRAEYRGGLDDFKPNVVAQSLYEKVSSEVDLEQLVKTLSPIDQASWASTLVNLKSMDAKALTTIWVTHIFEEGLENISTSPKAYVNLLTTVKKLSSFKTREKIELASRLYKYLDPVLDLDINQNTNQRRPNEIVHAFCTTCNIYTAKPENIASSHLVYLIGVLDMHKRKNFELDSENWGLYALYASNLCSQLRAKNDEACNQLEEDYKDAIQRAQDTASNPTQRISAFVTSAEALLLDITVNEEDFDNMIKTIDKEFKVSIDISDHSLKTLKYRVRTVKSRFNKLRG